MQKSLTTGTRAAVSGRSVVLTKVVGEERLGECAFAYTTPGWDTHSLRTRQLCTRKEGVWNVLGVPVAMATGDVRWKADKFNVELGLPSEVTGEGQSLPSFIADTILP